MTEFQKLVLRALYLLVAVVVSSNGPYRRALLDDIAKALK